MSPNTSHSGPERRDSSPEGKARRARFEASLKLLADLVPLADADRYPSALSPWLGPAGHMNIGTSLL